jgi:dUTP pyrophosphatase
MNLAFFKTHNAAHIPAFETEGAACFDFKASLVPGSEVSYYNSFNVKEVVHVSPNKSFMATPKCRYLVPTNLIMDIPEGYSVRIHPRSGLALKNGITLINCEGVIDSDYINPTYITLYNSSDSSFEVKDGDRIAQGELVRQEMYSIAQTDTAPTQKTSRAGGFGSTGV